MKIKKIPQFKSEAIERRFWQTHDTTEYFDVTRPLAVAFPNLQPSTKTISLRLPESLLSDLKMTANKKDVPYQSLLKVWLAERVAIEVGCVNNPKLAN